MDVSCIAKHAKLIEDEYTKVLSATEADSIADALMQLGVKVGTTIINECAGQPIPFR